MSGASDRVPSGGGGLRIVLFVLGGLLLAGLLVCAGAGFLAYRTIAPAFEAGMQVLEDTAGSQATAQSFLEALQRARLDDAYGMTTDVFQARMSRQGLEDFCNKHDSLRKSAPIDTANLTFAVENLHTRTFSYPLPETDGEAVAVQLTVVKEEGAFRIDDLCVVPVPQLPEGEEPPRNLEAPDDGKQLEQEGAVGSKP